MTHTIRLADVNFTYEGKETPAIADCSFEIRPNEIVFITGRSGSGKSSLLHIINGVIPEVIEGDLRGSIFFGDEENTDITRRNHDIANVFQNPRSQFFTNDSTAELVFEMENDGYPKEEMRQRLGRLVERYHIEELLSRDIQSLSSGERQFLALLSAIITDPSYVLFDEPSSNLDYGNAMRLKRQILDLQSQGKTIVVCDHRCFYLDGIIDRVFLLEDRHVRIFDSQEEFEKSPYFNRNFDLFSYPYPPRTKSPPGEELLRVEHLSYKHILRDISFSLYENQITFLTGINGAGKTTLANLLCDKKAKEQSSIRVESLPLYIIQDADYQLFGSSVLHELSLSCDDDQKNREALEKVDLLSLADQHPHQLSGGEKQRLQISLSLISDSPIIIFDEPTSGLDRKNMDNIIRHLEALKERRAILIISHDYEFIRHVADRVLYMKKGEIIKDFPIDDVQSLNSIFLDMEASYDEEI